MSAVAVPRASQALYRRRKLVNAIAISLACAAAVFGLAFLGWILWTLVAKGFAGLNLALFTQDQPAPMDVGGLRNAFVGSILMCGMGLLIGTPMGIAAGTWLAEYGNNRKLGTVVRFVNDILLSAPSIVLGLFVYAIFVMQFSGGRFSAIAGAVALAFIVLPVVVRTTDEMLRLVPSQMREAALSLGVPQWKVIMQVLYRSALPGIVTGILLALAHISGETAPLLFTQDQPAPMDIGGLRNAFVGSILMCGMGLLIGTPMGIAAGTWLAEYGNNRKLGTVVRFVNDILLSAPSIVLGLFVYAIFVMQFSGGRFSAIAGAVALAFIVLPVVVRTTDEMLRLVPSQMREAALSLGVPQWKVIMQVLYRSALPGIVTGILLALARISGETAPLLFTAFGNGYLSFDVSREMSAVPLVMYRFAGSGFENWEQIAWAGAMVLTMFVLAVSLVARTILLRNKIAND